MIRMPGVRWYGTATEKVAKYSAFLVRLGVTLPEKELETALWYKPGERTRYLVLGEKVAGMYVAEFLCAKYPKMPGETVESSLRSFVGVSALADVADSFGVKNVMIWNPVADSQGRTGERAVSSQVMLAVLGLIYKHLGPKAARAFISRHILSRHSDLSVYLDLEKPLRKLVTITTHLGRKRPVARLLKESGRGSDTAIFFVGLFSGTDMIGEGYGHSLEIARERAARDALMAYFLKELKELKPEDLVNDDDIPFFDELPENTEN